MKVRRGDTTAAGAASADGRAAGPESRHVSDHLANERTFLAWIRTAVAIMGLGFVVAKFGIYLKALASGSHTIEPTSSRSGIVGIVLVAASAATVIMAVLRYLRTRRLIDQDAYHASDWMDITIGILVAVSAIAMMLVLLTTTR